MITKPDDGQTGGKPSRSPGAASRAGRSGRGEGSSLQCLPSKLRPPRPHVELVARDALVATLLRSSEPLVLVSAPAGSGKTVTLAQWLHAERRPSIWLRLDGNDNDPLVLLRCLAVALDQVLGVDPEILELLRCAARRSSSAFCPGSRPRWPARGRSCSCWTTASSWRSRRRGRTSDSYSRTCRRARSWSWRRAATRRCRSAGGRACGELLEVRFAELAFDRDEAIELLRLHTAGEGSVEGAGARDVVAELLEATEGWATGLYLASQTARGRSPDEWLPGVRGDQRAIAGYLLGEVLERQPTDLQRFLLETAILDELTAPLCAAVTGRADAGAVLTRLARENLFVSALDDRDERYRYHHLFADLLRSRLERLEPERPPLLHRLAAAWCEAHDEPEPAIRHYLAAGDVAATVGLAEATIDTMLNAIFRRARAASSGCTRRSSCWRTRRSRSPPAGSTRACRDARAGASLGATHAGAGLRGRSFIVRSGIAALILALLIGDSHTQGLGQMRRAAEEALRLETTPGDWRDIAMDSVASCQYLSGSAGTGRADVARAVARDDLRRDGFGARVERRDTRTARAHRRRRRSMGRGREAAEGGREALSAHGSGRDAPQRDGCPCSLPTCVSCPIGAIRRRSPSRGRSTAS